MVAWPGPDGQEFNKLDQVVQRLRSARNSGKQRFNAYEIGIATPTDDAIAVPILVGGKDRRVIGFPCLSHLSFSLNKGVVHLSAIYRSHDFISRAYGNYVGLGRVLHFVAQQSGIPAGELTCLSASATVEIGKAGVGKRSLQRLLKDCHQALAATL
jgi:thymidylate synthase